MTLIFIVFGLFILGFFSNWAMDSISHKLSQVPKWLYNWNGILIDSWFGMNKHRFWWIPSALCDAWHFWKTFLVGSFIGLASLLLAHLICFELRTMVPFWNNAGFIFVTLSVIWNVGWYVFYDLRYKTKRK